MLKNLIKMTKKPYDDFLDELLLPDFNEIKLKKHLNSGKVDINQINSKSETFLHITLKQRNISASIWLLRHDLDIGICDNEGKTPFDIAIEQKYHRIVDLILSTVKIDIDNKDRFGRTVLQDAVVLGDHEMAKILLKHGADINSRDNKGRNVMYDALSYGHMDFIDYLLDFPELDLNNTDEEQFTVLRHSFVKDNDELAIKLIEHGADPNIRDAEGNTFLCEAAKRGMEAFEIIEISIKQGFNISARVADENTILIEVISVFSTIPKEDLNRRASLYEMSKMLVESGIDINAVNSNNENALFQAVRVGDAEQVSMLLGAGINVNLQNNDGETPLSLAAYGGIEKLDILILLLKHKADPFIPDKKNKTLFEVLNEIVLSNHGKRELIDNDVLKYAIGGTKFIHVLKTILEHNTGELDFWDSTGRPIFFLPLLYNSIPLFKLYIKAGVDLQMLNKNGQNLFFEYVLKVFEDDDENIDFQSALSILISAKVDHNTTDETGWTVINKVIASTPCNFNLFKTLVKVVRFDYKIVDKMGRTAIHTAVWSGNVNVIKVINYIDKDIKDIPDYYGILPSIYSALIGNRELLLYFVDIKAQIRTKNPISKAAVKKFSPLLKNIEKLAAQTENDDEMYKLQIVIRQLKKDFVL